MTFNCGDASAKEAHCIADSDPAEGAVHRVKQMLKRSVKNKLS